MKWKSQAERRYAFRVGIAMLCYMATLYLAQNWIGHRHLTAIETALLALLPGLSIAGVFWALGRLIIETDDEFQRLLLVRRVLIASGLTMVVSTVWGFLEGYRIVAHISPIYLIVLFFVGLGVGGLVNWLTLVREARP